VNQVTGWPGTWRWSISILISLSWLAAGAHCRTCRHMSPHHTRPPTFIATIWLGVPLYTDQFGSKTEPPTTWWNN
jgi:hypothetical protein